MDKDTVAEPQVVGASQRNWVPYVVLGWVIPGGGHFALKRFGRGAVLAGCVIAMFLLGLAMHGKLYSYNPADIVDSIAWLANLGAGGVFVAAKFLGYEVPEPSSAVGDYGTKFLLTAGLLNILVILDAFDVATGRKG